MKKKFYSGYAVVTEDFTATSFSDYDLDTCKRYCRKGYVIIRTFKKKIGFDLRVFWRKWYRPIEFRLRWREFNILWFHVRWNDFSIDEWEKIVVWKPE